MAEYIPCDIPVFHCKFLIMRRRNVLTYFWLLDSSHFITAAEVNLQLWGDRFFPSSTARASEKLNSAVSTLPFARWVACRIEGMSSPKSQLVLPCTRLARAAISSQAHSAWRKGWSDCLLAGAFHLSAGGAHTRVLPRFR